ncbi:MAG: hypothetical protein KME26_24055 [Oscillatoria princeps RMCB-10]|nr:hypothetical protein [Oscillatoria princeps RMCB-10]
MPACLWADPTESAWGAGGQGHGRCDGSCSDRWTLSRLSWDTLRAGAANIRPDACLKPRGDRRSGSGGFWQPRLPSL